MHLAAPFACALLQVQVEREQLLASKREAVQAEVRAKAEGGTKAGERDKAEEGDKAERAGAGASGSVVCVCVCACLQACCLINTGPVQSTLI